MTRLESLLSHGPDRPLLRALTAGWVALTIVHFTIWAMIVTISGDLDSPWWLAITAGLGTPLAAAWWLTGESAQT